MKRPAGFTLLAIIFGVLVLLGISGSWRLFSGSADGMSVITGGITLFFGLSAAATTAGLWRCAAWVTPALRLWIAAFFILILAFVYQASSMFVGSLPGLTGFLLVLAGLLLLLDRYVRRKIAIATGLA